MKAFTMGINKADFMKEILSHQAADNFTRLTYNEGAGGCAVGCSLKSVAKIKNIKINVSNHKEYENHLGIPEWIAMIEDKLFENVSLSRMKTWPVEFSQAINEGADLNKIKIPMLIFIVEQARQHEKNEKSLAAIDGVLTELRKDVPELYLLRKAHAYAASGAASYAADAAARTKQYDKFADKLIELLKGCV